MPQNAQHGNRGARPRTEVNKPKGQLKLNHVNSGISNTPTHGPTGGNPGNLDISGLPQHNNQKTTTPGPIGSNLGNLGVPSLPQHNNQKTNSAYQRGRASDSNRSLSGNQTSFLNNKCLVIKGISKHLNNDQVKRKINSIVQRDIGFLFDPIILSKETQKNRTMVFELNEVVFATLSNPDIWDHTVQVAEFVGNRFWRKNNVKFTHRQNSRLVRDS